MHTVQLYLQVIESFFNDKCVSGNEKPMESKAFELNLDFTFLATSQDCVDATESKTKDRPDTECLWVLGESDAHKHLLTNPVFSLMTFSWPSAFNLVHKS